MLNPFVNNVMLENYNALAESGCAKNVNCGMLRRIGKSYALRQLIANYRAKNPDAYIILLIRHRGNIRQYADLIKGGTVNLITDCSRPERLYGWDKAAVFSDEIKNAEFWIRENFGNSLEYVGGFYCDHINYNRELRVVLDLLNRREPVAAVEKLESLL